MPRQLREGLQRRPRGSPPRPIAEQLPSISVNDLQIPSPYDYKTYILPNISHFDIRNWPVPGCPFTPSNSITRHYIAELRGQYKHFASSTSRRASEFATPSSAPVKDSSSSSTTAIETGPADVAAGPSTPRTLDQRSRPILQASRIQSFLDNKPRLFRRTRERLKKKLGEKVMMAQGSLGTNARSLWK
jgi:hypothetical protein